MVDRVVSASNKDEARTPDEQKAHEEEMIRVADKGTTRISDTDSRTGEETNLEQQAEETSVAQRPEDIPEKFWDAEKGEVNVSALLKAQQDAEAALRRSQQEGKAETQSDAEQQDAPSDQTSVVANASAEYAEHGALSDDTFAALQSVGISREMVNEYIAGQQAIIGKLQDAAYGELGGAEEYKAAVEWAAQNLSEEEIDALNLQLTSVEAGIVRAGAKALAEKFRADQPVDPTVDIAGDGNAATSGAYYKSGAEMRADMRDPRYKSDPAFRQGVQDKIARADRAGVDLFA